jgi:hypothetical protein
MSAEVSREREHQRRQGDCASGGSVSRPRSELFRPPTFGEMPDDHQVKALFEHFPYMWSRGQRDAIESLGDVLWYAREQHLYRKGGCFSWEQYCLSYYRVPAEALDALIAFVRAVKGDAARLRTSSLDAAKEAFKQYLQLQAALSESDLAELALWLQRTGARGLAV